MNTALLPKRVKIVTAGDENTGKSCLIKRYCENQFVKAYIPSIGIDYGCRDYIHQDELQMKIDWWDVGGNPIYAPIRTEFYDNIDALLLVYDVNSRKSFESLDKWLVEIQNMSMNSGAHSEEPSVGFWKEQLVYLIGNKVDKLDKRQVLKDEGRKLAEKFGFKFFETSALDGDNVNTVFESMLNNVGKKIQSLIKSGK